MARKSTELHVARVDASGRPAFRMGGRSGTDPGDRGGCRRRPLRI